jgi:hypothetical protein
MERGSEATLRLVRAPGAKDRFGLRARTDSVSRFDAVESPAVGNPCVQCPARQFGRQIKLFKNIYRTIACKECSITVACYLCNTIPKTLSLPRFEAVPLLRVQGASVIVSVRRRGASRGRPVLGGSLKSLAFSCGSVRKREAARRCYWGQGNQP